MLPYSASCGVRRFSNPEASLSTSFLRPSICHPSSVFVSVTLSSSIFESLPAMPLYLNATFSPFSDSSEYCLSLMNSTARLRIPSHVPLKFISRQMNPNLGYAAETIAKNMAILPIDLNHSTKMLSTPPSTAPISTSTVTMTAHIREK